MLNAIMPKHREFLRQTMEASMSDMEKDYLPKRFENINQLRNFYFWDKVTIMSSSRELCEYLKNYFQITNKLLKTF